MGDRGGGERTRSRSSSSSKSMTTTTTSLDLPHAALLIYRIKQWRVRSRRAELEKIVGEVHGVDGNLKESTNKALSGENEEGEGEAGEEGEGSCAIPGPIEVERNDSSYVSLRELS